LPAADVAPDDDDGEDLAGEPVAATGPEARRLVDVSRKAALTAERTAIANTLTQVNWNRRKAAERLGVSYKTLLNKIKQTRLEQP
jgi:DNA-binding NtrC family response regulator